LQGGTVGVVVASKHPDYKRATTSSASVGWQEYSIVDAGMPGSHPQGRHQPGAALCLPRRGRHARRHRVVRADEDLRAEGGADDRRQRRSGAVGSAVGQLAKTRGCRAVGIAEPAPTSASS
jgi:hypothetical protein